MKKLFSLLCLLVLSAVTVVQAGTYSFSWSNSSARIITRDGGDYVGIEYTISRGNNSASEYPKLVIYFTFTDTYNYGNQICPAPGEYPRKTSPTTSNSVFVDTNNWWWDYNDSNYDQVIPKTKILTSANNSIEFDAGTFYFAQGANGYPYAYSTGFTHTITIGEQLVGGTISAEASPAEGGNASVSPSGYQAGGSSVTLSATPNSGYAFLRWQDAGGNTISTTANTSVSVNGTATYTAVFATARTITVNSANDTQGTATGGGTFAEGATTEIRATANSGYSFSHWDDGNTDNPRSIIVSADKLTYTAYFEDYTSSMSIASCSSGADIEARFDYSNVTTGIYSGDGYNRFYTEADGQVYICRIQATNSSNETLTLFILPTDARDYQGGECSKKLSNAPIPYSYLLKKPLSLDSYYTDDWTLQENTATVYQRYDQYDATSSHCDIIMSNGDDWNLDAGGNIVVSQNNVGGLFIETENVTEDAQGQSVYFTLGNRSENTVNLGTGTMTASGSNLTFNASKVENSQNYAAKIKIKQNTTGSVTQTNLDLAQSSFLYQDSYIEEIKSITGTLSKSGNTYTLSLKIRDCSENLYIVTMSAPAPVYNITYKNKDNAAFTGTQTNAPTTHTFGTATTLRIPTRTGYTFGGWYRASDCASQAVGNASAASLGATAVTADITLYAKWTVNTYNITFKNEDGTTLKKSDGTTDAVYSVAYGETPAYDGATPTKTDPGYTYTFSGWSDGTNTYGIGDALPTVTDNTTYTATFNAVAATTLDLYDDRDETYYNNIKALNGQTYDVTYHRSVKYESDNGNARWYTLCLPFDVDQSQLDINGLTGKVYEYRYAEGSADENDHVTFHFRAVKSPGYMHAGQGYLVKATGDMGPDFTFENVTLNTSADVVNGNVDNLKNSNAYKESGDIAIVGVLRSGTLSNDDRKVMGLANNKIWYPHSSGNPMPAYRAYFYNPNASASSVMPRVRIEVEGEGTTELEVVDGELYDAGGDDRAPSKYIRNGVLIIERNGVRYDAQGKRM